MDCNDDFGRHPMNPIRIIGMGLATADLTETHLKLIDQADVLVGRKRHLDAFKAHRGVKKVIDGNMDGLIQFLKEQMHENAIVVLVSGDPLFYGVGARLIQSLGPDRVAVFPNLTLVAAAFSRIKASWQDARVIDLLERNAEAELVHALKTAKNIAVYTNHGKNPSWLARLLLNKGFTDVDMCVLEQLGASSESVDWFSPAQAARERFREPNLVVLKRGFSVVEEVEPLYPGMPDETFESGKGRGVHPEIRAVILSRLRLSANHVFWDLHAGSGAFSVEASLFVTRGGIFIVEKNHELLGRIEANRERFNIRNLEVLPSRPPDGLETLPPPDRVLIGAESGDLESIIRIASEYLTPGGVMVVNTERFGDVGLAANAMKRAGLETDFIQVQVSRARPMPGGERLAAENPVWIVSGKSAMLPMVLPEPGSATRWKNFRDNVMGKLKSLLSKLRRRK